MNKKINSYIFIQILKSCMLVFFIFLTIAWSLQLTRLLTITNFIQIDFLNIIGLSFLLIPNLLTVIIPFIIIFGILLCFLKLNRDKELISIYSLGFEQKPLKYSIFLFSFILIFTYTCLNFYISPKIYKSYKQKEFELRNTINFDKMIFSNFLKINENTTVDFKKNNELYEDIFISFKDSKENIIFAKNGFIKNNLTDYVFQLNQGFKLSIDNNSDIEKLEFENYVLKINNQNKIEFNPYDRNSFTIIQDIKNKNYLNIAYKISDVILLILIIYLFYKNNLLNLNFAIKNNIFFITISILLLLSNQLIKNAEINFDMFIYIIFFICCLVLLIFKIKLKYE